MGRRFLMPEGHKGNPLSVRDMARAAPPVRTMDQKKGRPLSGPPFFDERAPRAGASVVSYQARTQVLTAPWRLKDIGFLICPKDMRNPHRNTKESFSRISGISR